MSAVREFLLAYRPSVPAVHSALSLCLRITYHFSFWSLTPTPPLQAMPLAPYPLVYTAMYLAITETFPPFPSPLMPHHTKTSKEKSGTELSVNP